MSDEEASGPAADEADTAGAGARAAGQVATSSRATSVTTVGAATDPDGGGRHDTSTDDPAAPRETADNDADDISGAEASEVREHRQTRRRRRLRRSFYVLVLLVCLGLAPITWAYVVTLPYRMTVADVPAEPVAIVPGAGLNADRTPTPWLAQRLDLAIQLYRAGKVKVFLVSGESSVGYDEPQAMRTYLREHGVPVDRIALDFAGMDTYDTCWRARHIFGVDHAIMVTQNFHLPRAVALCRSLGIDTYGVGGATPLSQSLTYYSGIREFGSDAKAMADVFVVHPGPAYAGQPDDAVKRALAATD